MTRRCNKCKRTLAIELFSWLSGSPPSPAGVCDYCLKRKVEPTEEPADEANGPEDDAAEEEEEAGEEQEGG